MQINADQLSHIRVISEWHDFENIKIEWNRLLKQSDADNIFLTWEWINCWRNSRKSLIKPLIIVIEQAGEIVGIAPFYIQQYQLAHLLSYNALRFAGDQAIGSEYSNFIVDRDNSTVIKARLWRHLLSPEVKTLWDFIWFTNIAAWSEGGKTLLQSLTEVKSLHYNQRLVEFSQVPLEQFRTGILPKLSKSLRTNIRQTSRRLDKLGTWQTTINDPDSGIPQQLDKLFSLHNQHWSHAGSSGSFQRRPELVAFYRLFVPLALNKGWLRLFSLESNNEIQAMQLGYVYNNDFLALQEGYNPKFLPGSGQVLRYSAFSYCRQEKLSCYDFLGEYSDHKRRWLAEKKLGVNLFIWQSKALNLPFYIKKIWPTGRYLKPCSCK
ncbi:GNAT family N-acetyltransferase [Psychromonas ossibalaenae]|uniref:GNAT family N-acetyltransferase n=1 Tax=Psychromonas ossibalaenae TaxID=444922 RepID=UPI000373C00C|nr:GNAT family N-acetyltransferase [Psychromonas ossibalaenae]